MDEEETYITSNDSEPNNKPNNMDNIDNEKFFRYDSDEDYNQ